MKNMSQNTKSVFLYNWMVVSYATVDSEISNSETARLLKHIYDTDQETQLKNSSRKITFKYKTNEGKDNEIEKLLIIDELRYNNGVLFGSVGMTNKTLDSMVRQIDEQTMEYCELTLSSPRNCYEFYTFFAICSKENKLLILRNTDMPYKLFELIATTLTCTLSSEPYKFRAELLSERDLKQRIKELRRVRLITSFSLHDYELTGKPSIRRLADIAANKRASCHVKFSPTIQYKLTNESIDELISISKDKNCSVFKIIDADSNDPTNDTIDLLKSLIQEKREINLNNQEAKDPDIVYREFLKIINV